MRAAEARKVVGMVVQMEEQKAEALKTQHGTLFTFAITHTTEMSTLIP